MQYVIEYIGKEGVKTTPTEPNPKLLQYRLESPYSGDLVEIPKDLQRHPFRGKYGMVWLHHKGFDGRPEHVCICCALGSAFLNSDGTVKISGGPFSTLPREWLKPTYSVEWVDMWNWGDHSPGANRGVDYKILRPVFRLTNHPSEFGGDQDE